MHPGVGDGCFLEEGVKLVRGCDAAIAAEIERHFDVTTALPGRMLVHNG